MPAPLPASALSMTQGGVALVTEADGQMPLDPVHATGLYRRDRRLLKVLRFTVNDQLPELVARVRTGPASDELIYSTGPHRITRRRSLAGGYQESLTIHAGVHVSLSIELVVDGSIVYNLGHPTVDMAAELQQSLHVDGFKIDSTSDGTTLTAWVNTEAQQQPVTLRWGIGVDVDTGPAITNTVDTGPVSTSTVVTSAVSTTDVELQRILDTAAWDLQALTVTEPVTGLAFPAAGAPHFLAVFGRDALLVSWLTMVIGTERALDTLEVLAHYQGTNARADTLEEPGRILHELRIGDMGVFGITPGTPYYGSVDSTPLFVVVLAECLRWGASRQRVAALLPAARSAVAWCRDHVDRFGFVHSVPHEEGIWNQGWKDSGNAVVRADGTHLRMEHTSLVEVQGYVHAALVGLAVLEEQVGNPDAAPALHAQAATFHDLFHQHFAVAAPTHLAMALDGAGQALAVRGSNVGHLLSTQLIDDALADRLAERLSSPQEFSGWGVRTLSTDELAYDPQGYHLGTVWPHDNALFLHGLNRRGLTDHIQIVSRALLDLAAALGGQLPELLGGFARSGHPQPVAYPASARPQAWAAAVPFQIVTAALGLRPDMTTDTLLVRPLRGWHVKVQNLQLGSRTLQLHASDGHIEITGDTDGLTIITG